jgi:hypothetical protein
MDPIAANLYVPHSMYVCMCVSMYVCMYMYVLQELLYMTFYSSYKNI